MKSSKQFPVLGEQVDIVISSSEARGSFSIVVQTCPPGGGPPPHSHQYEDEIFRALEGDFEIFDGEKWNKLPPDEYVYSLRGSVHTFRNCGTTVGKLQAIVIPGKFESYLESISPLEMPRDAAKLAEISAEFGVRFVTPALPAMPPL